MKKIFLITASLMLFTTLSFAKSNGSNLSTHSAKKSLAHKKKLKSQKTKVSSHKRVGPQVSEQSQSVDQQFSTLGDNQVFIDRVKNMDSDRKIRIVENRTVDLNNRIEIAGNYGLVGGGDSYLNSTNYGALVEYHFNPHWSLGVRYEKFRSTLTSEGKNQAAAAQAAGSGALYSGTDAPQSSGMLTASYSPIYGKLNLFDMGVAHFDIYTMIGYGKMQVLSGSSDTMAAGGGIALWLSQHFATRLEVRYQTYKDLLSANYGSQDRRENTVQGMFSIGVLL